MLYKIYTEKKGKREKERDALFHPNFSYTQLSFCNLASRCDCAFAIFGRVNFLGSCHVAAKFRSRGPREPSEFVVSISRRASNSAWI